MEEVKTLKQDIEALVQRVDSVTSREVSLAKTKLEEAAMWVGVELNKFAESKPQEPAVQSEASVAEQGADAETPATEAVEETAEPTV